MQTEYWDWMDGWMWARAVTGPEGQHEAQTTGPDLLIHLSRLRVSRAEYSSWPAPWQAGAWSSPRTPQFPAAASGHYAWLSLGCEIRPSHRVVRGLFTVPISASQCLALGNRLSGKSLVWVLRETHWTPVRSVYGRFYHEALVLETKYNQPCRLEFILAGV